MSEFPKWTEHANCRGVAADLFFPARGDSVEEAKAVCRGCTVRAQCLEYALVNVEKYGVWGGLSERERRRIRTARARARSRQAAS
jgi:WhiB family redox-sensing transcriptional regulator